MPEMIRAKSSVKSGVENGKYLTQVLDGTPPKKSVEEIEKENSPKTAPESAAA